MVDDDVGGDGGDVGVGVHGGDDGNGGDVFVDDDAYPRLPLTPFHSLGWFFWTQLSQFFAVSYWHELEKTQQNNCLLRAHCDPNPQILEQISTYCSA